MPCVNESIRTRPWPRCAPSLEVGFAPVVTETHWIHLAPACHLPVSPALDSTKRGQAQADLQLTTAHSAYVNRLLLTVVEIETAQRHPSMCAPSTVVHGTKQAQVRAGVIAVMSSCTTRRGRRARSPTHPHHSVGLFTPICSILPWLAHWHGCWILRDAYLCSFLVLQQPVPKSFILLSFSNKLLLKTQDLHIQ